MGALSIPNPDRKKQLLVWTFSFQRKKNNLSLSKLKENISGFDRELIFIL